MEFLKCHFENPGAKTILLILVMMNLSENTRKKSEK
jgi:hypothetical protein